MRSFLSFLSSCLVVGALAACGTARDADPSGTTFCFNCHSETTDLGKKILWAQAGYDHSVHKNGQIGRIYVQVTTAADCTPFPAGSCYVATGTEFEGSNAFYANSGGCQMCHTNEGFRKRVAGNYDAEDGSYSIKFSWNTAAWTGTPTTTPNTPLTRDVILNPSPLSCFGCHTPHGIGTSDGEHLDQTIPVGTTITTQAGGVWGGNKAKGHMCAECHQVRLNNQPSTSASIVASVKGTGKFNITAPYGAHHGPQTDMNLGTGGAQYSGSTPEGLTFAGAYNNSPHHDRTDADCVSCHMQDDYSDINVTGSFGVNAAVGGHSFTNKGFVHGTEKALIIGCGSTGCHTAAGVATSTGNRVVAASVGGSCGTGCTPFSGPSEYLQANDAYFQKLTGSAANAADSNYHLKVNELLSKLARPSAACAGLLNEAAVAAGGAIDWAKMVDDTTVDPRCIFNGSTTGVNKAANAADDNTNASVRFVKGLWNFKMVLEDKSFSVHNTRFALELLYDSCSDLAALTGKTCGATSGRCSFCEGTFVTDRP